MSNLDRGSLPPGAEFAPLVPIGVRPSTLGDWEQVERRLSVRDPDDQRAIWRRAALLHGASEDQAMHSRIEFTRIGRRDVLVWRLSIPSRWFVEGEATTWGDYTAATAALCARVWGTR